MSELIDAPTLKSWINDGEELALLDVREAGQFGEDHSCTPFRAPTASSKPVLLCSPPHHRTHRCRRRHRAESRSSPGWHGIQRYFYSGWRQRSLGGRRCEVFQGVNVYRKHSQVVEHAADTPRIAAEELNTMMEAGENMVIVDGRTPSEHHRMSIPGAISLPNAEMVYRIHDLAPDPETTVVVNCAGRTRSIIGARRSSMRVCPTGWWR